MNTHIEDINNLFSHNNITKDKVDIVTQIGNVFELYRSEDIENLIKITNDNNLAILNDCNITKEFNNLLQTYKNNANINEIVFDNIILSVKKLYNPKNIDLSYRQHCHEIFSLLSNILLEDNEVTPFMYELLYQKLLINQLNSEETIDALINNDLNRYITQDKLLLIRPDISNLLKLSNIFTFDDMNKNLKDIKDKINLSNKKENLNMKKKIKRVSLNEKDFNENESEVVEGDDVEVASIDDEVDPDEEFQEEDEFTQENMNKKKSLKKPLKKDIKRNLSMLNKVNSDTFDTKDGKYSIDIDCNNSAKFYDDDDYKSGKAYYCGSVTNNSTGKVIYKMQYDVDPAPTREEAAEDIWNDFLSIKDNDDENDLISYGAEYYPENLSNNKRGTSKNMRKRIRNLNSAMLEEGQEDKVNEITEISPSLPEEMQEEDLVKAIAIELSKQRKLIENMSKRIERSMNLSKREKDLDRALIQLSEVAEELEDEADNLEKDAKELESLTDELYEATENVESSDSEAEVMEEEESEEGEREENLSFRRKRVRPLKSSNLSRNTNYRASSVNLSQNKVNQKSSGRSGIDILFNR